MADSFQGLLMNPVTEHLMYLLCLTSFVDDFKEATGALFRSEQQLRDEVKMDPSVEGFYYNFREWLDDVEYILIETKVLETEISQRKGCFMYGLSKRLNHTTKRALKLLNECPFSQQFEIVKLSVKPARWSSVLAMVVKQSVPTPTYYNGNWKLQPIYDLVKGIDKERPDLTYSVEPFTLKNGDGLRDIWDGCVYTPNLTHLEIIDCWNLRYVLSPTMVKNLPLLKVLRISNCDQLKAVVGKDNHGDGELDTYFPNLEIIRIWYCKKLKCIFPVSFAVGGLSKLSSLSLKWNDELEKVFDGENEVVHDPKILVFPLLAELRLEYLPKLSSFSPVGYHFIFPRFDFRPTLNRCDNIATYFTFDSLEGSVHAEFKYNARRLGPYFSVKSKEDLQPYCPDGSSTSQAQDPQT